MERRHERLEHHVCRSTAFHFQPGENRNRSVALRAPIDRHRLVVSINKCNFRNMKKVILGGVAAIAIAVLAAVNVNLNLQNENLLSDLAL